MTQQAFEQLMTKYEADPSFRDALKQDPVGAAERAGIPVDDEVRGFLQTIEPTMSDEELKQRVSKGYKFG